MRPQAPQGRLKALASSDHWVFQATRPPTPRAGMGPERLGPDPLEASEAVVSPLTPNMLTGPLRTGARTGEPSSQTGFPLAQGSASPAVWGSPPHAGLCTLPCGWTPGGCFSSGLSARPRWVPTRQGPQARLPDPSRHLQVKASPPSLRLFVPSPPPQAGHAPPPPGHWVPGQDLLPHPGPWGRTSWAMAGRPTRAIQVLAEGAPSGPGGQSGPCLP